jgi:hypothetical protein
VRELERQVDQADARLRAIEDQLSAPAALDAETLRQLGDEHAQLTEQVAVLTERWAAKAETAEPQALPAS